MSFSMSSHVIGIETVAIGFGFPNMDISVRHHAFGYSQPGHDHKDACRFDIPR
jgi:hypothetical protein